MRIDVPEGYRSKNLEDRRYDTPYEQLLGLLKMYGHGVSYWNLPWERKSGGGGTPAPNWTPGSPMDIPSRDPRRLIDQDLMEGRGAAPLILIMPSDDAIRQLFVER